MPASASTARKRKIAWLDDPRHCRVLFVAVLVSGLALDLWSKARVFEAIPSYASEWITVIDGFFYLRHVENDGAVWSLFPGLPSWFWVAVRGTVFFLLLVFYLTRVRAGWWVHLGFALVMAGACGNVYDNLFAEGGRVRDWLHFVFWGWPFPTFNVADSMITVGAGLLLIYFYRLEATSRSEPT